jgi:uncharacterized protein YndB with AHSA1/START domain
MSKQVGLTKDAGYQFGIRKTFPVSVEEAWDFMFSKKGLKTWLGDLDQDLMVKNPFKTGNGISGVVRILKPYSHIRMNWKKKPWNNISTLQIRFIRDNSKTTISFHQEKLKDSMQREEMKRYWNGKIEELKNNF